MTNLFLHVPLQEKVLFTKNLALSLRSGISLVKSLQFFRNQTGNRSFRKILDSSIEDVNRGLFLSASLKKHERVFGELFINIIRIGETSGNLPENLMYLGDELKKKADLRKKVRGASIYPIVVFIATIGIAVSMILFVFPKILPLFQNFKAELPFTTRLLIKISNLITGYGFVLLGGGIAAIIGIVFLLKIRPIRYGYHRLLLSLPIVRRVVINFNIANFSRTLGVLLKSGVGIIDAITITGNSLPNLVYARRLAEAGDEVKQGSFFSKFLSGHPKQFPALVVNMLEVGENTGNLTENLFYLAEYYENEVDDFVRNLSSILEPVLLLFMGGIVGFIALSFITPIYQLTRSIK